MNKNLKNSIIYVPSIGKYGRVISTAKNGKPRQIYSDGEIIEVVGLAFKLVGLFKQLFLLIKGIFK